VLASSLSLFLLLSRLLSFFSFVHIHSLSAVCCCCRFRSPPFCPSLAVLLVASLPIFALQHFYLRLFRHSVIRCVACKRGREAKNVEKRGVRCENE
jgi:hypothetical protein